ncbi:MAG: tetratricopeptide (TPR) repeat protein [Planctomycetota bacterium]|jgi:tetratricopeptide (TPR) repeat protein
MWLVSACTLTPAPVAEELTASGDQQCLAAVAAFRAQPTDATLALTATRLLFVTADEAVQNALLEVARSLSSPDVAAVLAADRLLPAKVRERVVSLATTGAEIAEAAVAALARESNQPVLAARVDAQVYLALHLSFVAWANGPVASLMAGYATRIVAAMEAALALDPFSDHGAPLRLRGRFLARAPWPVGDLKKARELLTRAVKHAPLPIHHLFLGDALFALGEQPAAIQQWQSVLLAKPDATTASVAMMHREMAQLRLRAAGQLPHK